MQTDPANHSLGFGIKAVRDRWGWFAALGVGMLIAGGIASSNLFAATLASVIYIGAMMLVAGVMQVAHALATSGWAKRSTPLLSGILYVVTGAIVFLDPVLASASISMVIGVFLSLSGISRIAYGFRKRTQSGHRWIIASGLLSLVGGMVIVAAWPGIGLWLLGALLSVDLLFQGWSFLIFGLTIRRRHKKSEYQLC